MENCIFCKIINGEIPSTKVYEDEQVYAFRDINPQAPTHILVIPKEHIPYADGINSENSAVIAHLFLVLIGQKLGRISLSGDLHDLKGHSLVHIMALNEIKHNVVTASDNRGNRTNSIFYKLIGVAKPASGSVSKS